MAVLGKNASHAGVPHGTTGGETVHSFFFFVILHTARQDQSLNLRHFRFKLVQGGKGQNYGLY